MSTTPLTDSPNIKLAIKQLSSHQPLSGTILGETMNEIMTGQASQGYIAAFLSLLNPNKFTPDIISTAARSMRSHALQWPINESTQLQCLDIVGTGGDGLDTYNVSTTAAFIISACGVPVVKHGNRSSSSKCGSADLLESAGINLDIDINDAFQIVTKCGFCFLYAQRMHPSMKHVGPIRKQLGIKTIFNVLGPLTNPCVPTYQLTGVYSYELGRIYVESLKQLGVKSALVVHSKEGMDEISCAEPSHIWHLHADGSITEYDVEPERDFGISVHHLAEVASGTPAENAVTLRKILSGVHSAESDHVYLNAAAALVVAGKCDTFKQAVNLCQQVCQNGAALNVLETYIKLSNEVKPIAKKQTILQTIAQNRIELVNVSKSQLSLRELYYQTIRQPIPSRIDILHRLHTARQHTPGKTALLAEIKRASPSAGDINSTIDPVKQALAYAAGGAAAISVLCEPKWFKGNLNDLRAIRAAFDCIPDRPAILLKDFIEDEYQLVEGRAAGADTVLLIVASLSHVKLIEYINISRQLGMEPLVEVANEDEMSVALSAGALLIGVNNRNLHTFTVDTQTTNRLAAAFHTRYSGLSTLSIERRPLLVALSGIKTRDDVIAYELSGAGAVLVGETLMKSNDARHEISVLLGTDSSNNKQSDDRRNLQLTAPPKHPYVKICGMRNVRDAIQASIAGADLIGLIFVQKSKRYVNVQQAQNIAHALGIQPTNITNTTTIIGVTNNSNGVSDIASYYKKKADQLTELVNTARQQHNRPLLVGVFMDETAERINEIASSVPLDIVQLHGNESYEFAAQINRPVIMAVSVNTNSTAKSVLEQIEPRNVTAILLDTKCSTGGGSGQVFDWSIAAEIQSQFPILLAGGLTPLNIVDAMNIVHPYGVDVASGVEYTDTSDQIHKNHYKVEQLITNAKIAG